MPWRLIFIVALLLASLLGNGAMLVYERIDPPASVIELHDNVRQKQYLYIPSKRKSNFTAMGLGGRVGAAVDLAARLDRSEARIREVIEESSDEIRYYLCDGGDLPPRFAVMAVVVQLDDKEVLRTVRADRASSFYAQDWFGSSLASDVYTKLELVENPMEDAAAVGVAAVLAGQEVRVLEQTAPFDPGFGGSWGLDDIFEQYGWVEPELIRYFATMHIMMEIANSEKGGICK